MRKISDIFPKALRSNWAFCLIRGALTDLANAFQPNRIVSKKTMFLLTSLWVFGAVMVWVNSPFEVIPKPQHVVTAFVKLWTKDGLSRELLQSFTLNLKALALATAITVALAISTVMPFMRPLVTAISKGRFLGLAGLTFVFTILVGGGSNLKISLLVFGIVVFFVTNMMAEVAGISKDKFDHARTLRMGEWRVVWEIVILGSVDKALEALRQNAAIGWMMLTMVEGISRSEGGVGALLLNTDKHFLLAEVFAIQFTILLLGVFQDYMIGGLKNLACPYSRIVLERK